MELEQVVFDLLKRTGKTMATAESCTGGYIAHRITSLPGASSIFMASAVTYSNLTKEEVLGVSGTNLEKYGAVSEQVVREMLSGVLAQTHADYGIAVSGILGPGGGSTEKPVGTVWIAAGSVSCVISRKFHFRYNRENNMKVACINALNMLREAIIGASKEA